MHPMRFLKINDTRAVNVASIEMITQDDSGFAIVHIGLDKFRSQFTYDAFLNLLAVDSVGNGPNPTATAVAY